MKRYDDIIIGGGAAGLSLAYALMKSDLRSRSVLVIDKDAKQSNDRTWCYWTSKADPFDNICYRSWDYLRFKDKGVDLKLDIRPFRYQMVRGIDFYRHILNLIAENRNFDFIQADVTAIEEEPDGVRIIADRESYFGRWAYDSRIKKLASSSVPSQYTLLYQHFLGWEIETEQPVFDPQTPTLFDLECPPEYEMAFYYILPFQERRGLVEFTLFSDGLLDKEDYRRALESYIEEKMKVRSYRVLEEEFGVIPMTDLPFPRRVGNCLLKLGTAGGRVKPSTGYAFSRIQRDSQAIIASLLKNDHPFDLPADPLRNRFYDTLMLSVISKEPLCARRALTALFTRNSPERILKFLDEQSSLPAEVGLIATLPPAPFLRSLIRKTTDLVRLKASP
jgi:lycopene beta-cyclase